MFGGEEGSGGVGPGARTLRIERDGAGVEFCGEADWLREVEDEEVDESIEDGWAFGEVPCPGL